jgi:nanoRNase/pAp phosphatase (c-di-AMP/oligoRNAs hydrolase)
MKEEKSNAQEDRFNRIEGIVRGEKVLILLHNNPDPDAISAGWAFSFLLKKRFHVGSLVVYGGRILREENRAMVRLLRIPIKPLEEVETDLRRYKIVALIDTQPRTGNNSLPKSAAPSIVIDHHPLRKKTLGVPYLDVRPRYGSTATMLTEYLLEADLSFTRRLATALYYGIKSDTQNLGRGADEADARAATFLYRKVLLMRLSQIEYPELPRRYFSEFDKAIHRSKIYQNLIVSEMGFLRNPDMVGLISDLLVRISGVHWSLAMGRDDSHLIFSLRTKHRNQNAGRMAQRLVKGLGTAGGHGMVAGGQIRIDGVLTEKEGQLSEILERRLRKHLGLEEAKEEDLIRE